MTYETNDLFVTAEWLEANDYYAMEKNVSLEDWLAYEPPLWMFICYAQDSFGTMHDLIAEWGNKKRTFEFTQVRHYWLQVAAAKDSAEVTEDDIVLLQQFFWRIQTANQEVGL